MRDQIEAFVNASHVTGLAAALIEEDTISAVYTFGELSGSAIHSDTRWSVASLTKPVFAYAVMGLIQQGILDLDRPLQTYLTQPYLDDAVYLPHMTARHALTHSTGFPNWRDSGGLRAAFMPGSKFSYSSEGLNYLQIVVESLTHMPLNDILRQQVFTPLAMQSSWLQVEAQADLPPHLQFLSGSLLANASLSLSTTIGDYGRFVAAVMGDSSVNNMIRPHIPVENVSDLYWGLGWGVQLIGSVESFWHWGARGMPRSMNFAMGIPDQHRGIVLFTNHADGLSLCREIIQQWAGVQTIPAFEWLLPAHEWRPDGKQRG